jgi:hypothetical protein
MRQCLAILFGCSILMLATASQARTHHHHHHHHRHHHRGHEAANADRESRGRSHARRHSERSGEATQGAFDNVRSGAGRTVAHPQGCPSTSFCGCGVALYVFGHQVRSLWLAANWLSFPSASPAPGMVAVRRGHVFAILANRGRGSVLAYDPNSGRHRTRIHVRSLAGFKVVNPHGGKRYADAG